MEAIQGACLNIGLPHLTEWNVARRKAAHRYHELLSDTPLLLPFEGDNAESIYHLYTIRSHKAVALREYLSENKIGFSQHYPIPMHLQECYNYLGYQVGDLPIAEHAAQACINLPIFPTISEQQLNRVSEVIHQFFAK